MTRLLRAELARVRARPIVWAAVALAALGAVGIVVLGWWDSRPPSPAHRLRAFIVPAIVRLPLVAGWSCQPFR